MDTRDRWIHGFNAGLLQSGFVAKKAKALRGVLIGHPMVKLSILVTPDQRSRDYDVLVNVYKRHASKVSEGDISDPHWEGRYQLEDYGDLTTFLQEGSKMGFRDDWLDQRTR